MDEQFQLASIPGLSFNSTTRGRRDPYSHEYLTRPFDTNGDTKMFSNGNLKQLGPSLGALGGAVDQFIGPNNGNQLGIERSGKYSSFIGVQKAFNQAQGGVENGLIGSGNPYAMAAGAFLKGTRAIDNKVFRNENGMYKSAGAKWASSLISPGTLAKNAVSGELFNSKGLKHELGFAKTGQESELMMKNQQIGSQMKNAVPTFQAPAYGKNGMKFRSKFSTY